MPKMTDAKVAGALFDFLAYLTCQPGTLKVGASHEVPMAMDALNAWAEERNFNLDEADVKNWNVECPASTAS